ncbi:uncharacterized protein [Triticum aestivum]|uniref:uncharacterized protein n=1 Tax=Triticum aestivum TaxID=4565 RepID=UPI001D027CB2|nr:uncharacterized protein LOC123153993 [Triticum aestivum]
MKKMGLVASRLCATTIHIITQLHLARSPDENLLKLLAIDGFMICVWLQTDSGGWALETMIDIEDGLWSLCPRIPARTRPNVLVEFQRSGKRNGDVVLLETLHMETADMAVLLESLHKLKHLRYLALVNADISILPGNIGKMKLLQFLVLVGCTELVNLPDSIVKLGQLRLLSLPEASMVPRGFSGLTNMRRLTMFRAHMDGDWCSLDELGPLSQLRFLELHQLENVSTASFAANARLGEKMHLIRLLLYCTSKMRYDGLVKKKEGVSDEEQQRIEKVFNKLCPPPGVEYLEINGYFGRQLPSWMMSTSMVPRNNLKTILFDDLACCTQLPNGLCQLPSLQFLQVSRAPCIKHVGTGFLQAAATSFPRLNEMILDGMVEWEEWEWEEQVQAMSRLEKLVLNRCRLRHVPPGLASNATSLKILALEHVKHLSYIERFPSVVELTVNGCPDLESITNLPNVQKLTIVNCPKLKVLERIASLERLLLRDYNMEKLPEYMRDIKARHLQLFCRLWLLSAVAAGQSGIEWDKFSHMEHVKAYSGDVDNQRKWYVLYTRGDNCKLDSNISSSTIFEETLSSCMVDQQGFESLYRMRRSTFSYVCSLVRIPFFEDMIAREPTFVDGRVLSLHDGVAIAPRVLNSGEPPKIVGSSLGVNESIVSLVTQRFVEAMWEPAFNHMRWADAKMEKVKRKFDKIHGLPNCCGVVHTTHITFGSQNHEPGDQQNDDRLMLVVDPDLKFTDTQLGSQNQLSVLHDSWFFESCQQGTLLNGSKLKFSDGLELSDGLEVGEYIIGDAGYPLRPWLLTPYELENGLSVSYAKVEFNRRHSASTAATLRALTRLKDTWKCLQGEGWHPNNQREMNRTIGACCILHNIVIDMEEGGGMLSNQEEKYMEQVRQLAEEDAVRVRDALSQYMINSGVHPMAAEEEREGVAAASGSGEENKEPQTSDQGKEKASGNGGRVMLSGWPGSTRMEKIKHKFEKIHGLPNCCGVAHTALITFGSQNRGHGENGSVLTKFVIDLDMRFVDIWLDCDLLKFFEEGALLNGIHRLNGSSLKLSDGLEVGEYIIGDAGYPLRPWLLTPYELENGLSVSDAKVEFNRRHSASTAATLRALTRLKDTWKCLQGEGWHPNNQREMNRTIGACCILHNIVIDMEEGGGMLSNQEEKYMEQVRQLAEEDAVRVRDALSQYMINSGVHPMAAEEEREGVAAASGSGEENKEPQTSDQGKEKASGNGGRVMLSGWPGSTRMEKIKHKFEKIHGLPNCCGVAHTALITFGSQNRGHGENGSVLTKFVIDLDMRFVDIWLDCDLLKFFEEGALLNGIHRLNGSSLKLSDGLEVGEYIIGDAGYPLRPWLLTPYELENGLSVSDAKVEFNRRHSASTAATLRALTRLKDTWKCLQGEGWHPNNQREMNRTIGACCILHNIVIDMEEGGGMLSNQEEKYMEQVRQLAEEDAVRVRDALSQYMINSGGAVIGQHSIKLSSAFHHCSWPGSTRMEKIKHKFEKIHGLPNCCGVAHTALITFGSQNRGHGENGSVLTKFVIDLDMRFVDIWLDCDLLKFFEEGALLNGIHRLNGSSLKLSDGLEVGEYIIGDAGYPLRPWLLTPYELENGLSVSDAKVEFNRRHSASTAATLRALTRLKDTWKCLQGEGWHPNNQREMNRTIGACCILHNIVIDMEEGGGMLSNQEEKYMEQVRQLAEEDAVRVRDALSQYMINSGVHTTAAEEEKEAAVVVACASGPGDENKEQTSDRGNEKTHDNGSKG